MSRLHWTIVALLVGCGGCPTPPQSPESEDDTATPSESAAAVDEDGAADEPMATESSDEGSSDEAGEPAPSKGLAKDPEFPENASVSEAIEAIPKGTERLNLDPEALGRPLQDPKIYEPCKVGNQHFKLRVAIWNGKAVGIDVDTKNKALADCIRSQVQGVTWPDKVRSLETVEFAF